MSAQEIPKIIPEPSEVSGPQNQQEPAEKRRSRLLFVIFFTLVMASAWIIIAFFFAVVTAARVTVPGAVATTLAVGFICFYLYYLIKKASKINKN